MQKFKISSLIFLFLLSTVSFAQKKEETTNGTINVDQVVITATRTPKLIKDVPILTRVITAKDIQKSGAVRLEDILSNELAGMEFHQAGYGTTMSYQGLDARNILVLINGERVAGEVNGNIDFSRINTLSIERIEVMKGSSSVLYGSSSMGATINIITKEASKKYAGGVEARYGTKYQTNEDSEGTKINLPNMNINGLFSTKQRWFSSVTDFQYLTSDAYRMVGSKEEERKYIKIDKENSFNIKVPEDGIVRVPIDKDGIVVSGNEIINIGQKFTFDITKNLQLKINGSYYTKTRYDLNDLSGLNSNIDKEGKYSGYNFDAKLDWKIADNQELAFSIHQNTSTQDEENSAVSTTIKKQRHRYFTPRAIYFNRHKFGLLTAGIDYDIEFLNYDQTTAGFDKKNEFHSISFYAQEELQIADKLDFTVGLRGLYSDFKENGAEWSGKTRVTPKAALTYKLSDVTLRANWSMGYRNPTLKERHIAYFQEHMKAWILGTEDLKPETNQYASISAEYFSPNRKVTLSVLGYGNWFKDKIDTYSTEVDLGSGKESAYKYANTQSTRILGVELSGRFIVTKNWQWNIHYAYNHNKEVAPTNSAQYIFTSPHTANISTNYAFRLCSHTRMDIRLIGQYIGAKEYEDRMPTVIKGAGVIPMIPAVFYGIYEGYQKGYMLLNSNVSISYRDNYQIGATFNNILDYKADVASFNSATTPGFNASFFIRVLF